MALEVSEIGSFHIGGRTVALAGLPVREIPIPGHPDALVIDANGEYFVEQTYVHYVKLAERRAPFPVVMIHGGGSTGAAWETTPDGRRGWQMAFLERGFDVYVVDQAERGRAGFAPPQIWPEPAIFPNAAFSWEHSRVGPPGSYHHDPARRNAFPDSQFPVAAFDDFMKRRVPYWGALHRSAAQRAYDELIQRVGPCVLLAHSSGGAYAFQTALNVTGLVKGVVALEPSGAPPLSEADTRAIRTIPHLFIWGDAVAQHPTHDHAARSARAWHDCLLKAGGTSTWMDLPALGVHGNSHQIMSDLNSDDIASLVHEWLERLWS